MGKNNKSWLLYVVWRTTVYCVVCTIGWDPTQADRVSANLWIISGQFFYKQIKELFSFCTACRGWTGHFFNNLWMFCAFYSKFLTWNLVSVSGMGLLKGPWGRIHTNVFLEIASLGFAWNIHFRTGSERRQYHCEIHCPVWFTLYIRVCALCVCKG